MHLGDLNGAYDQYRVALELNPRSAVAHSNLGGLLAQIGMLNEGIAEFQEALRLNPNDEQAKLKLQYATAELKNRGKKTQAVADTGNK